jgi:hypothetical protein
MPSLWSRRHRNHADGCVRWLLSLQGLWSDAKAEAGGLLCLLYIWHCRLLTTIGLLAGLLLMAVAAGRAPAYACGPQVRVTFTEETPDYFVIEFLYGPGRLLEALTLELAETASRAHVDTAYGASDQQKASGVDLAGVDGFGTGSDRGTLRFRSFPPGARFAYLVDLDAAKPAFGDPNHLAKAEMRGGRASAVIVTAEGRKETITGIFDEEGVALLGPKACV